jgi:NADP-dependent 3-hydroxy acid dehydrogenase YdfG
MEGPFTGKVAVITGGSRGIGKAIALKLAAEGAELCLIGRNLETLQETACQSGAPARLYKTDLSIPKEVESLVERLNAELERVDILVNCAATYARAEFIPAPVEEFDKLYAVNVRAPFRLTQGLLPDLIETKGQVVFINSSVVRAPAPKVAHYAATKHALRSLADTLREEVNEKGVRVISIYPGRTAGAIQEWLFEQEKRPYKPERLLQPDDIAEMVYHALTQPCTAEMTDIYSRPFRKLLVHLLSAFAFLDFVGIV